MATARRIGSVMTGHRKFNTPVAKCTYVILFVRLAYENASRTLEAVFSKETNQSGLSGFTGLLYLNLCRIFYLDI
jgi:amino acid permease